MPTKSQILRKEQVLSGLIETRQNILTEAVSLSDEQQNQVFLGRWSIKDLLAHLIGWDLTNLDAVKSILSGKVPDFYQHHDRDWQAYNGILVKKHKKDSLQELLTNAESHKDNCLNS
jgi:hypothetical protein